MVASKYPSRDAADGRDSAASAGAEAGLGAVRDLVDNAARLDLRAPELALVLGERAAALAETAGANDLWVRAESLVVNARVRLGHRASMVGRVVAALRAAEDADQRVLAARLRTDLSVCARSVGAPLIGLSALRPVLTTTGLSARDRAAALCHLVGCLGRLGRRAELDRVLTQADRVVSGDDELGDDDKLLARALIRVSTSAHRRRHGDLVGAADAARTGIGFLDHMADKSTDGGGARVRLVLELVCALLDRGDCEPALEVAQPVLGEPVRAAGVAPTGWLRLALATRAHLPAGSAAAAARMLREAVHSATGHGLHALSARLWLELAHVEEQIGVPTEAIACLHRARACEHVHSRARSQARALLTGEFGTGEQEPVNLAEIVGTASETPPAVPSAPSAPSTPPAPSTSSRRERAELPGLRLARELAAASNAGASATTPRAAANGAQVEHVPKPALKPEAVPEPKPEPEPEPTPAPERAPEAEREPDAPSDTGRTEPPADAAGVPQPPATPARSTRHDSEHGSVAARSVLDRLGIATGGPGGRRRAAETTGEDGGGPESSPAPAREPSSAEEQPPAPDPEPAPAPSPAQADEPVINLPEESSWLPRLRLPPSLAPVEHLDVGTDSADRTDRADRTDGSDTADSAGTANGMSSAGHRQPDPEPERDRPDPAPEPAQRAEPAQSGEGGQASEDPPADAGLAELLVRALAEHQAGTSSASALVKQLGVDENNGSSRVNGRHRSEG